MKLKTKIIVFSSLFMLTVIFMMNTAIYYMFYQISMNNELRELQSVTNHVIASLQQNPEADHRAMMEAYLPPNGMIRVIIDSGVPIYEQIARFRGNIKLMKRVKLFIVARKLLSLKNHSFGPQVNIKVKLLRFKFPIN